MDSTLLLIAYFGPETVLPMTSVVATVAGLFMMFGRTLFRLTFRRMRSRSAAPRPSGAVPQPHFLKREVARSAAEERSFQ